MGYKRPDWDDFCETHWLEACQVVLERKLEDVLELVGTKYEDDVYDELRDLYVHDEADYGDRMYDQMRDEKLLGE